MMNGSRRMSMAATEGLAHNTYEDLGQPEILIICLMGTMYRARKTCRSS